MTIALPARMTEAGDGPRAVIASWLAGLFFAPLPVEAVADYCSTDGGRLLEAIGDEVDCRPGIDQMRSALAADASPAAIARELSIAYTLLFEGVSGPGTVSLYESAYAGSGGRLFQQATGDMEVLLQRYDLSVRKDCSEPPDHLSIELALLSTVLRRGDDEGIALLRDRLLRWVSEFADRCAMADRSGFYRGAAMVLSNLLKPPVLRTAQCAA